MAEVWRTFEIDVGSARYGFTAAVIEDGKVGTPWPVVTNRFGTWRVEEGLYLTDLLMPEQRHAEWSVKEVSPATIKVPAELLAAL